MWDPARVQVTGPLAPYAADFRKELARLGYTPGSACRVLSLMGHFSRWLDRGQVGVGDVAPADVEQFCRDRREEGYVHCLTPKALRPLLAYLRRLGVIPTPPARRPLTAVDEVIERYLSYLVADRGAAPETIRMYARVGRQFLSTPGLELDQLTGADVIAFVSAECPRLGSASAANLVKGLRSLLRFLHVEGITPTGLATCVPGAAGWRLAPLPQPINPAVVSQLLASCDQRTQAGLRDRAVMTVLARLGLRASEVALLQLADVDWRSGEVSVRGKGRRQDRLPLPVDVGEAVVGWLRRRPSCDCPTVFTTVRAPLGPLGARGVSAIVLRASRRCGLEPLGAHRLRHTLATELLRAGADLGEIGLVLRHQRLATTAIYAKVDRLRLSALAQPWPAGAA